MSFPPLKSIRVSVLLIGCLATTSHAADVTPYLNAGLGVLDDDSRSDFNGLISGTVRGGIEIGRYFALETEGQFGLLTKEETFTITPERRDERRAKIDTQLGIFAVGRAPLSEAFSLHGRIGYGSYKLDVKTDQFFQDEIPSTIEGTFEQNGVILGVGGQYLFGSKKVDGVRFDANVLIDSDGVESETGLPTIEGVPGITFSYVRKF